MLYHNIEQLIGNTPLLLPENYNRRFAGGGEILCKLECFNPAGSAKDRVALFMLNDALSRGSIGKGATVIEPTSGNTGIGLAALAAARGYRLILTMPDSMSEERRRLLRAYGAEIVLTPGKEGMQGAVARAIELQREIPNSFIPSQFDNPANPRAHFETTGPEIYRDADGRVDAFVAGVGTGGTISGVGAYLKSMCPSCRVIAVEPAGSPLLSKGHAGAHGLQGIGANFVPENLDKELLDEIVTVTEEEAYAAARAFAHTEGFLVGITSGAALHAATVLAGREEFRGKRIVALLPDTGERYLSTSLFEEGTK
ncbi:MAG: cysteine synthase A [Ruminococcaceae bacterium]|nr:cysteine synthase A [Oscillospiraceae bacterium]